MRRIALLICTNLAILVMLGLTTTLLGLNQFMTAQGLSLLTLLGFCAVLGFGGAFISLLISKPMAKWSMSVRVLDGTENAQAAWLVATVRRLADRAGIGMPEVGLYEGAPNAFATGARRDAALVAVSTGLLQSMSQEQVEAVLAHEVGHIQNGDMVTLTLVQGVMNTFVLAISRLVGYFVDRVVLKNESDRPGIGYLGTVILMDILLGVLAALVVARVSRSREYRADAQAAALMGSPRPMVSALRALQQTSAGELSANLKALGISSGASRAQQIGAWFASHPPLEDRIRALEGR